MTRCWLQLSPDTYDLVLPWWYPLAAVESSNEDLDGISITMLLIKGCGWSLGVFLLFLIPPNYGRKHTTLVF